MLGWLFKNEHLRKRLKSLGLIENDEGYWYYPSYSIEPYGFIMASYHNYVRICQDVAVYKGNIVHFHHLEQSPEYNTDTQEEEIINKIQEILIKYKSLKTLAKMAEIEKDFE